MPRINERQKLELEALELLSSRITDDTSKIPSRVAAARRAGASWGAIGKALKTSRQNVWQQYHHLDLESRSTGLE